MTMVECFMNNSDTPCTRFLSEKDIDQIGVLLKERGWFGDSRHKWTRNWSQFIHPYRIQLSALETVSELEHYFDGSGSYFFGKKL